jgi:hypothetical protein
MPCFLYFTVFYAPGAEFAAITAFRAGQARGPVQVMVV